MVDRPLTVPIKDETLQAEINHLYDIYDHNGDQKWNFNYKE
jgi:hypothetical protein